MAFLVNLDSFVEELSSLLRDVLNNNRRRQSSTNDVQVRIIEESVVEQSDGSLRFSLIAQQQDGGVVQGSLLERTVESNGQVLANQVRT